MAHPHNRPQPRPRRLNDVEPDRAGELARLRAEAERAYQHALEARGQLRLFE